MVSNGSSNLQSVTNLGNRTSNIIQSKTLVIGDTTQNISALPGSLSGGVATNTGLINSDTAGNGSLSYGFADSAGKIQTTGAGSFSLGYVKGSIGLISAKATGSFARGYTKNYPGVGYETFSNEIISSGQGSFSSGYTYSGGIYSSSFGSHAFGAAMYGGIIQSIGQGSFASGAIYGLANYPFGTTQITSSGYASFAQGYSANGV